MEDPGIPIGLMVNSTVWFLEQSQKKITTQRHEIHEASQTKRQMTYQKLVMFAKIQGAVPLELYHQIFPKAVDAVSQ